MTDWGSFHFPAIALSLASSITRSELLRADVGDDALKSSGTLINHHTLADLGGNHCLMCAKTFSRMPHVCQAVTAAKCKMTQILC